MIKVKVGLTWIFDWAFDPCIQQVASIKDDRCRIKNLKGNAVWGREGAITVPIATLENVLNNDPEYKIFNQYNTKLGKILYK